MRRFKSSFWIGSFAFLFVSFRLITWTLPLGLKSRLGYGELPISCTLNQCASIMRNGGPDYAYYLNLGNFFNLSGSFITITEWMLKAWPPGMGYYYSFLSKLVFNQQNFLFVHIVLMAVGWSYVLSQPVFRSKNIPTSLLRCSLVIIMLDLSLFRDWLFSGFIVYSETLSLLLCFLFLNVYARVFDSQNFPTFKGKAVIAGLLLSCAAYVRIVYDLTGMLLIFVFLIFIVFGVVRRKHYIWENWFKATALVLLTFILATSPWRFFAYEKLNSHSFTFASNSGGAWINAWTPSDRWIAGGNEYFVKVGINHLCVSYPETCAKLTEDDFMNAEKLAQIGIKSILDEPERWVSVRFSTFQSSLKESTKSLVTGLGYYTTIILFVLNLGYVLFCFFWRRQEVFKKAFAYAFVGLLFTFASIAPLAITAFEPRYLYTFVLTPWLIAINTFEISPNHFYRKRFGFAGFPKTI